MVAARSPQEVFGHPFTKLLGEMPQATWDLRTTIYEDDILFLEWAPRAAATASRTPSTPSSSATA
jgi:hypothetical protein